MTRPHKKYKRRAILTLEARLWRNVEKSDDGCWLWTKAVRRDGYGAIEEYGTKFNHAVHRLSWMLANGPIPEGLYVCHHCDTKRCVRPDHLFLGTAKDNTQDCIKKGRFQNVSPYRKTKLTEDIVRSILEMSNGGARQIEICKSLNLRDDQVCRIVNRKRWKHVKENVNECR